MSTREPRRYGSRIGPASFLREWEKRVWVIPPFLMSSSTQRMKDGLGLTKSGSSSGRGGLLPPVSFLSLSEEAAAPPPEEDPVPVAPRFGFLLSSGMLSFSSPTSSKSAATNATLTTFTNAVTPALASIILRTLSHLNVRYGAPPTGWTNSAAPHPARLDDIALEERKVAERYEPIHPMEGRATRRSVRSRDSRTSLLRS
mmetsp:Transcript_35372/g.105663  ORF Transcript_35372/g.105663 Transcript_35372/m.105663 type:complete len:200 (-) Transcript_35372:98-697(-)